MTKCYLRRKSINSTTLYNTTSTINDHMQKLLSHPIISTKRKIYSWCFASCLCGTRFHVFKGDIRVNFSTITCQNDLNFFLKKKKKSFLSIVLSQLYPTIDASILNLIAFEIIIQWVS